MIEPLKYGPTRFYFPETPDNKFDGCSVNSCGPYTGDIINGLQCRRIIMTFPHDEYNERNFPWKGELQIITNHPILVKLWSDRSSTYTETFYLIP